MILISNETLLIIQNMTWNGAQGFQRKPIEPFYIPYHDDPSESTLANSRIFRTTHTERGLTWVSVDLAGHSEFLRQRTKRKLLKFESSGPAICPFRFLQTFRVLAWKNRLAFEQCLSPQVFTRRVKLHLGMGQVHPSSDSL